MQIYKPKTREELKALCDDESINLGLIDTSLITDMSGLFKDSKRVDFSGIESWDTSNVLDMSHMFEGAESFNEPLNWWNVANVRYMTSMFERAKSFNQPLDAWNVSNVLYMSYMFAWAESFNQDISMWDIWNIMTDRMFRIMEAGFDWRDFATDVTCMFRGATSFDFEKNIDEWVEFRIRHL